MGMLKEDPYQAFEVPGGGQPYLDATICAMVYWTNISRGEAEDIRKGGMVSVDLATNKRTACLAVCEFGRRDGELGTSIFAKWLSGGSSGGH